MVIFHSCVNLPEGTDLFPYVSLQDVVGFRSKMHCQELRALGALGGVPGGGSTMENLMQRFPEKKPLSAEIMEMPLFWG